jgi:hypothetical protein
VLTKGSERTAVGQDGGDSKVGDGSTQRVCEACTRGRGGHG